MKPATYNEVKKTSTESIYSTDNGLTVRIPTHIVKSTTEMAEKLKVSAAGYLHANDRTLVEKLSTQKIIPYNTLRSELNRISKRYETLKEIIPPMFLPEYEGVSAWQDPETGIWYDTFPTADTIINMFANQWGPNQQKSFVSPSNIEAIRIFAGHAYQEGKEIVEEELVERTDSYVKQFRDEQSREYVLNQVRYVFTELEKYSGLIPPETVFQEDARMDTLNKPFWYAFIKKEEQAELIDTYIAGFKEEFSLSEEKFYDLQTQGKFRNIVHIDTYHKNVGFEDMKNQRAEQLFKEDPLSLQGKQLLRVPEEMRKEHFAGIVEEVLPTLEEKIHLQVKKFPALFGTSIGSYRGQEIDECIKQAIRDEFKQRSPDEQKELIQKTHKQARYRKEII